MLNYLILGTFILGRRDQNLKFQIPNSSDLTLVFLYLNTVLKVYIQTNMVFTMITCHFLQPLVQGVTLKDV